MLKEHEELFDTFKGIHDAYILNPQANQARFNHIGSEVLDVIREYERKLCGNMNSGVYGAFSQNLSQNSGMKYEKYTEKSTSSART